MSSGGYKISNQHAVHFITFAVVEWADVFTRPMYQNIVLDSLKHCQNEKGLVLNAWCLMSNHIHFVGSSKKGDLSGILRDFKGYSSKQLIQAIAANPRESRKGWLLSLFRKCGEGNSRNKEFQFWRQDNQPKECITIPFTMQKINYIHQNPVVAGLVRTAGEYRLSSAIDYMAGRQCGLLDVDVSLNNLKGC